MNALIWTQGFSKGMNPFSVQKTLVQVDWVQDATLQPFRNPEERKGPNRGFPKTCEELQ